MRPDTKQAPEGKRCQLQTLNQAPLLPTINTSRGDRTSPALERIERIDVSAVGELNGRTVYIMDVYLYQAGAQSSFCRLSSTAFLSVTTADRSPDFRVTRRYSEYIELSVDVYNHAFAHYVQRCQFCTRIVENVALGPTLATKLISRKETKLKHLTAFMQLLLRLAQIRTESQQPCKSQIHIQDVVYKFIQSQQQGD